MLGLLGESERLERVWDSGSDHSAELVEVENTLADLTDQLGTGVFTRGTPQRARLDTRIAVLAARQAELSTETVKPSGWTWQPTGETFGDWWARQDVTAQNVWLRSMGVRLDYVCSAPDNGRIGIDRVNLDLGDLATLTEQLNTTGPAARWQEVFASMGESGIAGVEINGETVAFVNSDGRRVEASELDSKGA